MTDIYSQKVELPEPDLYDDFHDKHGFSTDKATKLVQEHMAKALEAAASQWDGCMYNSVGEEINIGDAIRNLIGRV